MDQTNFIVFPEYVVDNGEREIHAAVAVYRNILLKTINEFARQKGIKIKDI